MKRCRRCNVIKELSEFDSSSRTKDGLSSYCPLCKKKHNEDAKTYRNRASKEKLKDINDRSKIKNRERVNKNNKHYVERLSTGYVKANLKQHYGFTDEYLEVNHEIIRLRKQQLKLKRLIWKTQKNLELN